MSDHAECRKPAVTICMICRKRVHQQRNGAWYHDRNGSVSCYPGSGSEKRATPIARSATRGSSK